MYFQYNNFEEIKKDLQDLINDYSAMVEAWQSVAIEKKKNGEEFAQIGRALKNAKLGQYYPFEDAGHPYITIAYKSGYYKTDSLPIFFYEDGLPKDNIIREALSVGYYIRQTYKMTADDIRNAINNRIGEYKKYIISLKTQLKCGEKMFNTFRNSIQNAIDKLKEEDLKIRDDKPFPTSLYHKIIGLSSFLGGLAAALGLIIYFNKLLKIPLINAIIYIIIILPPLILFGVFPIRRNVAPRRAAISIKIIACDRKF